MDQIEHNTQGDLNMLYVTTEVLIDFIYQDGIECMPSTFRTTCHS